ncbi:methyltransferase domain-containing protein [Streptomyces clavuligerus]|uniref:DNA topoisomerase (ATP-hydrolyzing) n=1 Tax=Streptomyces clavuligerus TaxID=1901 RepID=B5GVP3_STRCL|nr:methyltransferase domain-containing protein [Streptomyces clavuligerus]ANW17151.1 recombinase RmuC [Streptomyces clavuligerus]AXU11691.1 methyltransferase domain-containing protein [Streptomyces clavuligerus]EDY50389.1 DNA topoisomerase II [Streptomyces clavuligerus]EFG10394.1 DNA topoisomerase II [Streptomyces clavuligerus]MBY6301531.1 methyltransferase domain-containing protein [Streptomyces clavuligerus]
MTTDYTAEAITVHSGLEAVRRNPSMYVGSTGPDGAHHLVLELVDNAVDEAAAGHCGAISVELYDDGSCSVTDDGRGIPTDPHPAAGVPACELVLTTLHSGGKFDDSSYATSAGLHGVGLACVNALSEWLRLDVWRDGAHHSESFARGSVETPLKRVGDSDRRGSRVWFRPDPEIFSSCLLDTDLVHARLLDIAYLHPGLRVELTDHRTGRHESLCETTGVRGLLAYRAHDAEKVHAEPTTIAWAGDGCVIDAAVQWTEGYAEQIFSYVNTVRTDLGGSHVDALRRALAGVVADHLGPSADRMTVVDILEGLTAVIAIRTPDARFDGQTKRTLRNDDAGARVFDVVTEQARRALAADPELARRIAERAIDASRARLAARLAGRTARSRTRAVEVDYAVYQRQFGIRSKDWHDSCAWLTDEDLLGKHAELCAVPPDARMLDVCCGSGVVGDAFRGRVGEMVGLDLTPEMAALAATRLDIVHQGTVYDLPFPDASFDLVVTREVLHLLPRPERPVSEIFRVLRPGGQFIVGQIVPYADVDAFWMFRVFKKKQPLLYQMFREEDFRALLTGGGFTDVRMEEYFLWESIDRWIDTHETTPANRQEIHRLYYDAPREVRAVHPFEVLPDGSVRDRWRWCVYSVRKPGHA